MSVQLVSGNRVYSFDEIMAAADMAPQFVPVPEWGDGGVMIQPMTTVETTHTAESATVAGKLDMARYSVALIAASLIDPPVSDEQATDMVARRSARAIRRIVEAVQDLNVTSEEAKQALQAEFPATA